MPERKNGTELSAVEPFIVCPNCKKEIRPTESLAAPLVEATRRQYEQKLADKDSEIARCEAEVRRQEKVVTEAQNAVDDHIAQGIRKERERIAAEERKKARILVSDELQAYRLAGARRRLRGNTLCNHPNNRRIRVDWDPCGISALRRGSLCTLCSACRKASSQPSRDFTFGSDGGEPVDWNSLRLGPVEKRGIVHFPGDSKPRELDLRGL